MDKIVISAIAATIAIGGAMLSLRHYKLRVYWKVWAITWGLSFFINLAVLTAVSGA